MNAAELSKSEVNMSRALVIGIAGGSGSGKTTLANKLIERFQKQIAIISHDYYYKPFSDLTLEQRKKQNFDHPASFDTDLLVGDLSDLALGKAVDIPTYSFVDFTRLKETATINPARVIIVEGILIYSSADLRDLCDIKIYVDIDADERFIRRLRRDVTERGRSVESVTNQYLETVKPMHSEFVEPTKKFADIIVPYGGHNLVALNMICDRIQSYLLNPN